MNCDQGRNRENLYKYDHYQKWKVWQKWCLQLLKIPHTWKEVIWGWEKLGNWALLHFKDLPTFLTLKKESIAGVGGSWHSEKTHLSAQLECLRHFHVWSKCLENGLPILPWSKDVAKLTPKVTVVDPSREVLAPALCTWLSGVSPSMAQWFGHPGRT